MDKGIGFNRHLHLPWLDAIAAFVAETEDSDALREQLEPIVGQDLEGVEARRKTIDLLLNIWLGSRAISPVLYAFAVNWNQQTTKPSDRIWLHYGLTILYYDFFRESAAIIGQISRYQDTVTTKSVRERMMRKRGQIGSVKRAVRYVVTTLRRWNILTSSDQRYTYIPRRQAFSASSPDLEAWLVACAMWKQPAEEIPFADLLRLPELFPFRFILSVRDFHDFDWFRVQRQGSGWDMVRLNKDVFKAGQETPPDF
jgi:hypothetical protein